LLNENCYTGEPPTGVLLGEEHRRLHYSVAVKCKIKICENNHALDFTYFFASFRCAFTVCGRSTPTLSFRLMAVVSVVSGNVHGALEVTRN
jgi:hypothetical protein